MAKYIALEVLSTGSGFVQPGEEIELDDSTALILLRQRAVKPAELVSEKEEVKDGTDNG